jgi:hypothetical protein
MLAAAAAARLGHPTAHFNVGQYRRKIKEGADMQDAQFFDHNNPVSACTQTYVMRVLCALKVGGVDATGGGSPAVRTRLSYCSRRAQSCRMQERKYPRHSSEHMCMSVHLEKLKHAQQCMLASACCCCCCRLVVLRVSTPSTWP